MRRLRRSLLLTALLAAPLAAEAVVLPHELDHLLCYRMRDPLTAAARFDLLAKLQPEFSRAGCWLAPDDDDGVHSQFCVPASKVNVDADPHNAALGGPPLSADYVCYRVECPAGPAPPNKIIEDQFGRRAVRFRAPARLCVPARKEPLPCGPTGTATAPQCGGDCPDPAQRCRREKRTGRCACEPDECRGKADAAGMCGGACPDPAQRCARGDDNRCVCAPRGCGVDPVSLQCSGACPVAGDLCTTDAAGDCRCLPPPPMCGLDPLTGECGGPCPTTGDACVADASGECACQPPPPTCGLETSGVCGGTCPPGLACLTRADGSCGCGQACGLDPGSGRCGGECPAGSVCGRPPASPNCECIDLP